MKFLLLLAASLATASADVWTDAFTLESTPIPAGIDPQIGGLDTLPDGRLAVCFHRGEVLIYNPADQSWTPFAHGLHEPLGILAESATSMVVMQRPELTRLRDTDGDGQADEYETIYDGFGMTGNYHEFAFGPARDKDGNFYVALNVASNGAGIRREIRGEWTPIGVPRETMYNSDGQWGKFKGKAGRMYSRVAYRGWVMRISPDGKTVTPFAAGFRSPDGIGIDAEGRILVTDNQGDWRGTSPLYHVEQDKFYGHPASLVWRSAWTRNPLEVPVPELDALRTPAIGLFPQGELANSPTQPIAIPSDTFGPFAGQTLIGEMNQPTLVRFLPDPVDGISQGTLVPFLQSKNLGIGNHRLTFTPDGALWIGKTHLSWAGAQGLVKVTLKDKHPFAIDSVHLLKDGFEVRLTEPVDPTSVKDLALTSHRYHYHATYGSPKVDEQTLPITSTTLSPDGKNLTLHTDGLREAHLHVLNLKSLKSTDGKPLLGDLAYYQLTKKR